MPTDRSRARRPAGRAPFLRGLASSLAVRRAGGTPPDRTGFRHQIATGARANAPIPSGPDGSWQNESRRQPRRSCAGPWTIELAKTACSLGFTHATDQRPATAPGWWNLSGQGCVTGAFPGLAAKNKPVGCGCRPQRFRRRCAPREVTQGADAGLRLGRFCSAASPIARGQAGTAGPDPACCHRDRAARCSPVDLAVEPNDRGPWTAHRGGPRTADRTRGGKELEALTPSVSVGRRWH